jgi:hypothetical protein
MPLIDLHLRETYIGEAEVQAIEDELFRLVDEPALIWFVEDDEDEQLVPRFGDVFRAALRRDGTYQLEAIVERAPLLRFTIGVTKNIAESDCLRAVLDELVAIGGHWERHLGGILLAAVPQSADFDLVGKVACLETVAAKTGLPQSPSDAQPLAQGADPLRQPPSGRSGPL